MYERGTLNNKTFTPSANGSHLRTTTLRTTTAVSPTSTPQGVPWRSTASVSISDLTWSHTLFSESRILTAASLTPVNNHEPINQVRYVYDAARHHTATLYDDGTSEVNTYDCCRITSMTDRNGITTHYNYDAQGNQDFVMVDGEDGYAQVT